MMDEKVKGNIINFACDPPGNVSWRFFPKKKGGKVSVHDMAKELFEQGMEGNIYVGIFKVPEEYPAEWEPFVDLYEPEDAFQILAELLHCSAGNTSDMIEILRKSGLYEEI